MKSKLYPVRRETDRRDGTFRCRTRRMRRLNRTTVSTRLSAIRASLTSILLARTITTLYNKNINEHFDST